MVLANKGKMHNAQAYATYLHHVQVTLFTLAFANRVFAYPWFYFSVIRSINFLSAAKIESLFITCVGSSPDLSGNVMQMKSLASKNSGTSLKSA
jgi:hypothetical protein